MRTTLLSLFVGLPLLMASGCASESDTKPVAEARAPTGSSFGAPGRVHAYRFRWVSRSEGRGPIVVPDELMVTGGLTLTGTLALRVHGEVEGGTLVEVRIQSLEESELLIFGQDVLHDPAPLLQTEAFVIVPPDGGTRQVYFEPDAPPLAREMLRGLLGQFDLRVPAEARTAADTVVSPQGLAEATFERDGRTSHRRLVAPLRTDAALPGNAARPRVDGERTIRLDEGGVVEHMQGTDVLVVPAAGEQPHLRTTTEFSAQREAVYDEDPPAMPNLDALEADDLWAAPDDAEARRLEAQRYARGLTSFDVSIAVRSAGNGLLPERGFVVRGVGMLRGWPQRARDMAEIFDANPDAASRQLVFDLLASAGTPESQAVMRELAGRADVEQAADYPDLLQRFAFIPRPEPQNASFLLEAHARASDGGPAESRLAVLYPMGSVARSLRQVDPLLAAALTERIRDDLTDVEDAEHTVAALAGLGNAGELADLDRILEHSRSSHTGIRGMSAAALRHLHDPRATDRLFELLGDRDPYVARQALQALTDHPLGEARADRLAAVGLTGAYEPGLAFALGDAMLAEEEPGTMQRSALLAMALRTADRPTERTLQRWLEGPR